MHSTEQQPRKGDHHDIIQQHLQRCGLRQTHQRKTILDVFLDMQGHPTVEEIHEEVTRRGHRLGLATIYRMLKVLVEAGIARRLEFGDGQARYERQDNEHQHLHLVCTRCGRTYEASTAVVDMIFEQLAKTHTFDLHSHATYLYGVCDECLPTDKETELNLKA